MSDEKLTCSICPHSCRLAEGGVGLCRGRIHKNGKIKALNYGQVTSMSLDPIEKKPLQRFYPGSMILSVGSFGCNFHCDFCQNHSISMVGKEEVMCTFVSPEDLIQKALELRDRSNIGIAFTYNEPLIGYEYVLDTAKMAKDMAAQKPADELKIVLVTNGFINEEPLKELLPFVDAMNIDLKSFSPEFYRKVGGDIEVIKNTIALAASSCHVEISTLVIPGENDDKHEMEELSRFLAAIDPEIVLHISRFFPQYRMLDQEPTPREVIFALAEIAAQNLKYVYKGNL